MAPINTQASTTVARALANTAPCRREALLVGIMQQAAEGLRHICGAEHASEEAYRVGDHLAVRGVS